MKINIEVEIPNFSWVDVPVHYHTPIGQVEDESMAENVNDIVRYLQQLPDIDFIVNSDHQHVRTVFCKQLLRERLRGFKENLAHFYAENLSYFLQSFENRTGLSFKEYVPSLEPSSSGKKIKFETFSQEFKDEDSAIRHAVGIYVRGRDFKYQEVSEGYEFNSVKPLEARLVKEGFSKVR